MLFSISSSESMASTLLLVRDTYTSSSSDQNLFRLMMQLGLILRGSLGLQILFLLSLLSAAAVVPLAGRGGHVRHASLQAHGGGGEVLPRGCPGNY